MHYLFLSQNPEKKKVVELFYKLHDIIHSQKLCDVKNNQEMTTALVKFSAAQSLCDIMQAHHELFDGNEYLSACQIQKKMYTILKQDEIIKKRVLNKVCLSEHMMIDWTVALPSMHEEI